MSRHNTNPKAPSGKNSNCKGFREHSSLDQPANLRSIDQLSSHLFSECGSWVLIGPDSNIPASPANPAVSMDRHNVVLPLIACEEDYLRDR